MSERWVTFTIFSNESLECLDCSKEIKNNTAHLYLNADNELDEVLCPSCWRKEMKRERRRSKRR